jgi:hypothetical protein
MRDTQNNIEKNAFYQISPENVQIFWVFKKEK